MGSGTFRCGVGTDGASVGAPQSPPLSLFSADASQLAAFFAFRIPAGQLSSYFLSSLCWPLKLLPEPSGSLRFGHRPFCPASVPVCFVFGLGLSTLSCPFTPSLSLHGNDSLPSLRLSGRQRLPLGAPARFRVCVLTAGSSRRALPGWQARCSRTMGCPVHGLLTGVHSAGRGFGRRVIQSKSPPRSCQTERPVLCLFTPLP